MRAILPAVLAVAVLLLLAAARAENILINYQYRCNATSGEPLGVLFMLFNDYGAPALLSTNVSAADTPGCTPNPPGLDFSFGPTLGCDPTASSCTLWQSVVPVFGDPSCGDACAYIPFSLPLLPGASSASFQSIQLCGVASWPSSGIAAQVWSANFTPSVADAALQCQSLPFACALSPPPSSPCGVSACRCNSFEFTQLRTNQSSAQTTLSVNVTNGCTAAFIDAAFALDQGLELVEPAVGSVFQGANYRWTVQLLNGSDPATPTTPALLWLRFVFLPASSSSQLQMAAGSKGAAWDVLTFTVENFAAASHLWTLQGHAGGYWDTFSGLSLATCACSQCDQSSSNGCAAGFAGQSCAQCDTDPFPHDGSHVWFCVPTGDPAQPYTLENLPRSAVNSSAAFSSPPGVEITSTNSSAMVDAEGYTVLCNCTRVVFDCAALQFCFGNGLCVPQTGECQCASGYSGPSCDISTNVSSSSDNCSQGGQFCSGRGLCVNNTCQCTNGFTGASCQLLPSAQYCQSASNCSVCQLSSGCVWCAAVPDGGGCVASDACLEPIASCSPSAVNFLPEPCPDACFSGSPLGGRCVNVSCAAATSAPAVNGIPACVPVLSIDVQTDAVFGNATLQNAGEAVCLCPAGTRGANCGEFPPPQSHGVHLSRAGAIALIVLGGVILFIPLAFGLKRLAECVFCRERLKAAREFSRRRLEDTEENVVPLQPIGTPPPHVLAMQQSAASLQRAPTRSDTSVVTLRQKGT